MSVRLIQREEHDDLRIVGRGIAGERNDKTAADLIRRARLAADAVARDLTVLARAVGHLVLHDLTHEGARFLRDDLTDGGSVVLIGDIAVLIDDLIDDVGRTQIPAVDAGDRGGQERHGCDVEVLAERVARQRQCGVGDLLVDEADGFTRGVDARLFHETECLHVVVEFLIADAKPDVDERGVAGVCKRCRQILRTVSLALGAVDGLALDIDRAAAGKGGVQVDRPLLKRHGKRERLERGARLVGVVDGLVSPLLEPEVGGMLDDLLLCQTGGENVAVQRAGIVEVVIRQRRHGEHCIGLAIHHDARCALAGAEARLQLLHALFEVILDRRVDGGVEAAAVLRVEILLVLIEYRRAVDVLCRHHHAALAGELLVIYGLQAVRAAVFVGKSNHVGRKRSVGIDPFGGRLEEDPAKLIGVDGFADFVRRLLIDLFLDNLVLGPGLFHVIVNAVLVHVKDGGKLVRDQGLILLILFDLIRGKENILRRRGHGENVPVAVIDRAAARLDRRFERLLRNSEGLELLMLCDLPLVELGKE